MSKRKKPKPAQRSAPGYGTPEYESAWVRAKLGLPANAPTAMVEAALHNWDARQRIYLAYIESFESNDNQAEVKRLLALLDWRDEVLTAIKRETHRLCEGYLGALGQQLGQTFRALFEQRPAPPPADPTPSPSPPAFDDAPAFDDDKGKDDRKRFE